MDDFEDSFNAESDAFTPEKPIKKAAAKKATTAKPATAKKATAAPKKAAAPKADKPPKADKAKAPAKPRAKKRKVVEPEELDEEMTFEMDRTFDVLETPQMSSDGPDVLSPPRPTVLKDSNAGGSKKNASETYQKVVVL
jgi:hypothetical protein